MQWLCDCYLPSLWRFVCARVSGDQHLAEDITSDTTLTLFTTIRIECHPDAEIQNIAGWMRTVAARKIADHFRAVSRVQHLISQATGSGRDTNVADPAAQQELRET